MDFTIDAYAELVSAAAARYRFLRFSETSADGEVVIWRHDIDVSPQRALAMARVEAASGVPATYFVQVSSRYYSIFEPEIAAVLRQIGALGHDIGLHFDAEVCSHQTNPDYDKRIAFEARLLEEVAETKVASFTLHNPTTLVGVSLNEPFRAGLVNGSCSDLRTSYSYCSDSNGLWRFRTLAEMIADPAVSRLYALTHPEWWQAEPMPPRHRLQRCIDGRKTWLENYYDALLAANNPSQYWKKRGYVMSNAKAEMEAMLEAFLAEVPGHYSVCSLQAPRNDCVTFLRSAKYIDQLHAMVNHGVANVTVIVPPALVLPAVSGLSYYRTEHVDLLFTMFNNHARKDYDPRPFDRISSSVILDQGAVIGAEGASIAKYKDERVLFRHYGRVVLEDNVYVGANAVIQRGRIDATVVGKGTMISSLCVVGANTIIGQNCTLTIQSGISGSRPYRKPGLAWDLGPRFAIM